MNRRVVDRRPVRWIFRLTGSLLIGCGLLACAPSERGERTEKKFRVVSGRDVYLRICATCHLADGSGSIGVVPPLQDSLAAHPDASVVARIVLHGLRGSVVREGRTYHGVMPPQATVLADAEIAAVVNYVRETWGRSDPVNTCSPETVAALRHKFAGRNSPWSRAELLAAP